MDENPKKEEQEVLLVVAKTDDNQLKVVHKSATKTGIMRSLVPTIENLEDFMKIDKHSNMLETFFTNFMHQCKNPTDFQFYHLPVALLDELDILRDMLKFPEENKDFLSQYEVNPEDYIKQGQQEQQKIQSKAPQEILETVSVDEQQMQHLGIENRIDWEQLARLGITRKSLEQSGDLSTILSGGKSDLITVSTEIEGIPITTQGRIHFQESIDGKLDLKIDCYRREPALDLPFHGVLLDKETKDNIFATGNAGHPVNLPLDGGEPKPCLVSLDKVTNNLVAVPVDDILIPMEIKDVTLTAEQHRQLSEGRKVLVEGMTSKWGNKFDAYMQYDVAQETFSYNFDGLDRNRYKKQENQQKEKTEPLQGNEQTVNNKFFIPKKLLGKELTPEQQEKFGKLETIYVTGMTDKKGQPFNSYVRMNPHLGKVDFFKYNPDKAQSRAKEITPTAEHKTQVAVNNGATDEATKQVRKPLKSAREQPAQVETAKKEIKKKNKGRKM